MTARQREPEHKVAVIVDGKELRGWTDYEIGSSLLMPADGFSMTLPFSREVWNLVKPDRPVIITIDGVAFCTGFLDTRRSSARDGAITITGRDKSGRLVQESAPAVNYQGLTLKRLVEKLAAPYFTVTLSNARNRNVMRGRGKKSRSSDAVYIDQAAGKRIEPGQTRWAVIEDLCQQVGYLAWSSADGKELIIGQPDYEQEVQYAFRRGNDRAPVKTNVLDLVVEDSTADRYSRILVLGSGAGTDANYGLPVAARAGEARNNPARPSGAGLDFFTSKQLVISDDDIGSRKLAAEQAKREMARRDVRKHVVTVEAPLHGQRVSGQYLTLFAPDTLAFVDDRDTGTHGVYLVVACTYRSSRNTGETTMLELLPRGTELSA